MLKEFWDIIEKFFSFSKRLQNMIPDSNNNRWMRPQESQNSRNRRRNTRNSRRNQRINSGIEFSDIENREHIIPSQNQNRTSQNIIWYDASSYLEESEMEEIIHSKKKRNQKLDQSKGNIQFNKDKIDFSDIVDGVTGEKIEPKKNQILYQCLHCSVVYLPDSFVFLKENNYGNCAGCGSKKIEAIQINEKTNLAKIINLDPRFVNLGNYKLFEGKVVEFTGTIVKILESKRGDYALMFEDKKWIEGFKLIVFYPLMKPGKGLEENFLKSLVNKKITVRGLIKNHETFGYEIIIYSRKMIKVLD